MPKRIDAKSLEHVLPTNTAPPHVVPEGVVWYPQPQQRLVLACPCDEILYGGAAGSGKTDLLVGDFASHMAKYGGNAHGLLVRRAFPHFQHILRRTKEVFGKAYGMHCWSNSDKTWYFPNGATLRLGYLDADDDVYQYDGVEFTWIGFDELTQWETSFCYDYMWSRLRSPVAGVKTRRVATTNPGRVGHAWVKQRFISVGPPMKPVYERLKVNGKTYERSRIFIPGRVTDNWYMMQDGSYVGNLLQLPEHQRRMLLEGDWNVAEGAFFTEWRPDIHVVPAFTPPDDWKRWVGADFGTHAPYAILWFTQSPHGDCFVYRELYGNKDDKEPWIGTNETAYEVGLKIAEIERDTHEFIRERWLDSHSFAQEGHEYSIAQEFQRAGIYFQPGMKTRGGKRKEGLIQAYRDALKVVNGKARLRYMDNCTHCIRTIPAVQIDKNNVEQFDTKGEDHCVDASLYGWNKGRLTEEALLRHGRVSRLNRAIADGVGEFGAH
jgi:hypothetical protein